LPRVAAKTPGESAGPVAGIAAPSLPAIAAASPANLEGATVVLRKQHFAVVGSLIALLAVALAVLAYLALRRPAEPTLGTTNPPPAPSTTTQSPLAPVTAETVSAEVGTTPQPTSLGLPTTATQQPAVATATSRPGASPAGTSRSPADVATPAGPGPGASNGTGTGVATADPAAAERGIAGKPPRSLTQPMTFDVRAFVGTGNRTRERDAQLILAEGKVTVTADDNHDALHSVPYESVVSITYSTGRDPMWKSPQGPAPVARAGGGFLGIRGDRHWVALRTKDAKDPFVVLRFGNPTAARSGLKALEERIGRVAETVFERKDAT
jgi:hypothetical protein